MNKQILIIEDESSIADNIIYALNIEGFECIWMNLAKDGIRHLKENKVDLVILDIGLPDQSGFETCKEIRQFSNTPIIFLTARSEEIDKVIGLEIGGDDYVTKPFSPRELVARVKVRINRNQQSNSSQQSKHSLFIQDMNKKRIFFKNTKLTLTSFEFKILTHLIQNPEYVLSRDQLLSVVRDKPEVALDRSIDSHIKSIRAKLNEVDNSISPIKTHRGQGYSLAL